MTGSRPYDYRWDKRVSLADLTVTKFNDSNAYWVVDYYANTNASAFNLDANSTLL